MKKMLVFAVIIMTMALVAGQAAQAMVITGEVVGADDRPLDGFYIYIYGPQGEYVSWSSVPSGTVYSFTLPGKPIGNYKIFVYSQNANMQSWLGFPLVLGGEDSKVVQKIMLPLPPYMLRQKTMTAGVYASGPNAGQMWAKISGVFQVNRSDIKGQAVDIRMFISVSYNTALAGENAYYVFSVEPVSKVTLVAGEVFEQTKYSITYVYPPGITPRSQNWGNLFCYAQAFESGNIFKPLTQLLFSGGAYVRW